MDESISSHLEMEETKKLFFSKITFVMLNKSRSSSTSNIQYMTGIGVVRQFKLIERRDIK